MSDSKKQNFLQGTALLAMATAIVKIIGAIYKIPLNAIIGKQGFSYYSTAYEIYNVLLMISTAGLPVAMSRMISQASSLGHNNRIRRIFQKGRILRPVRVHTVIYGNKRVACLDKRLGKLYVIFIRFIPRHQTAAVKIHDGCKSVRRGQVCVE